MPRRFNHLNCVDHHDTREFGTRGVTLWTEPEEEQIKILATVQPFSLENLRFKIPGKGTSWVFSGSVVRNWKQQTTALSMEAITEERKVMTGETDG